jgi:membrane protein implicated in regulation of membrane protease activity
LPALYKPWSISFLLALQVAVLGGVSLGASAYYFGLLAGYRAWPMMAAVGVVYFVFQIWLYWRLLSKGSVHGESQKSDADEHGKRTDE